MDMPREYVDAVRGISYAMLSRGHEFELSDVCDMLQESVVRIGQPNSDLEDAYLDAGCDPAGWVSIDITSPHLHSTL